LPNSPSHFFKTLETYMEKWYHRNRKLDKIGFSKSWNLGHGSFPTWKLREHRNRNLEKTAIFPDLGLGTWISRSLGIDQVIRQFLNVLSIGGFTENCIVLEDRLSTKEYVLL